MRCTMQGGGIVAAVEVMELYEHGDALNQGCCACFLDFMFRLCFGFACRQLSHVDGRWCCTLPIVPGLSGQEDCSVGWDGPVGTCTLHG